MDKEDLFLVFYGRQQMVNGRMVLKREGKENRTRTRPVILEASVVVAIE